MDYKAQLIAISNTLTEVKICIGSLQAFLTYAEGSKESGEYLATLTDRLERAVIPARNLLESTRKRLEPARVAAPTLPYINVSGEVKIVEDSWLHIRLNTLLPHCRYQTPAYLTDTVTRLLDGFAAQKGKLPFYNKAMLIIDEHCDIDSRVVFDQDNKGYKAIPNALKGRIFPDDDQLKLDLSLVTTEDGEPFCNIFVINQVEAGAFFTLRTDGYL